MIYSVKPEKDSENGFLETRRDSTLNLLNEVIQWLWRKAKQKKPIPKTRIQTCRALIYGCSVYLDALKDVELDKLTEEVEAIKEHVGLRR